MKLAPEGPPTPYPGEHQPVPDQGAEALGLLNPDLLKHGRDLLCVHDLQGHLLSVNPMPARILGYSVEEILQIPMGNLVAPEFRARFEAYLNEIARSREASGVFAVVTRTGQRRLWEYHCSLCSEGIDKPVVHGIAHDITDRVEAKTALRNANKLLEEHKTRHDLLLRDLLLFRTLLDQSNDAIEVVDGDTMRFLDVNEKACTELGYTRNELSSMTVFDIDPQLTAEKLAQDLETIRDRGSVMVETLHRRKDGTTFPVEVSIKVVHLDKDYVVAVSRDITERKLREERLREYERVVESLDEMIVVVNREHRYVLANRAFLNQRAVTREQVVGRPLTEILSGDTYESTIKQRLDQCFQGKIVTDEMKCTYPDLGERELSVTYLPVEGPAGIDRVAAITRDITERKRAAAALEESERRFRAWHTRAPVGIALVDSHTGKFLQVNPKYCEIVGRTEREMLQLRFQDITHPEDVDSSDDRLAQMLEEKLPGYDLEKRYVHPDGRVVRVNLSVVPMWEPGEQIRWHMSIVQDITERRMAEDALRESEERLRLAQDVAHIGTFERNLRTGQGRWTPQLEAIHGLAPGGYPKSIEKYLDLVHREDRAHMSALITKSYETGEGRGEWRVVWPDGTVRWMCGRWRVFKDSSEEPRRIIGIDFDVTEHKEAEAALRAAKEKLAEEKLYLEQEIHTELGFEEIIGQSKAIKAVMENASRVATSNATVLLFGETGVGKELVARAIHRLSHRTHNPFIKLNCAAIPSGLLESELFGAEKGAFTGSVSTKIGRMELADKGTIFLDEIGEIPLHLQPKLLRVLQDQEFERLGGTKTIQVDFRLIAATNRDLGESVRENQFRQDLYYRLNVFPIRVPALRERREDIPLLVEHFVQKCGRRMSKLITSVPKKAMNALVGWDWPGNVRELENFIERSVILTQGSVLNVPLSELRPMIADKKHDETLKGAERRHILRALRESHGQISGPRGAAARLGLKRTTLQSKLKQLGIDPRSPTA
jgi:formate hydrogenlyase transcriptional activator